mgnify:FL=1
MHTPDSPGRDQVRFPKLPHKSKSVPANVKNNPSELDLVTAKSWFYCTPKSQFGNNSLIQVSNQTPNARLPH